MILLPPTCALVRRSTLVAAAIAALLPAAARAEFRHAMVIGQSTYASGTLAAPPRDVAAVAEALRKRGFTVTKAENLATVKDLDQAVKAFAKSVPTNGTALVYFSGHAAIATITSGTNPPRSDTALIVGDGGRHPVTVVLRPLVAPGFCPPHGGGLKGPQSGSRINVVIVDGEPLLPAPAPAATGPAPAPASQPAEPLAPPPQVDLLPESLVILRPLDAAGAAAGPSPLAQALVQALASEKPLDAVLSGLSSRSLSSLAAGELARLSGPASQAVSPPDTLAPGPRPGAEWVDKHGIVFCWCPPGEFTIGSPPAERQRQPDEPQARVSFSAGFWVAKHELCYRESLPMEVPHNWSSGDHKLLPLDSADSKGVPNLPELIKKFAPAAPAGWEYDLPTEAEWEYAARAGSTTAYSFGDDPADLGQHGNFADRTLRESTTAWQRARSLQWGGSSKGLETGLYSYAHPSWSDGTAAMALVGSYRPNAWGLCDVHGNVAEITTTPLDPARLAPVVSATAGIEFWKKPENSRRGYAFVCKGGSWASTPDYCRSAFRGHHRVADLVVGVRLVLRRAGAAAEPPAARGTTLVPASFAAKSGATATPAADGTLLVTGTIAVGDTYTVTCPLPAGIDPREVRLEPLGDPSLPGQGAGRVAGSFSIAEVSLAGSRGGGQAGPLEVLHSNAAAVTDGNPQTTWGHFPGGKLQEAVFTIGLPSRNGPDGARWRFPAADSSPLTTLIVTIEHRKTLGPAPLGKFRISVFHEEPAPASSKPTP